MKEQILRFFEKRLRCKIYRNSLPRGCDIFFDIDRHYGIGTFRTVFDIGANIGQSAIQYHETFPEADIYSFEPVSASFRELEANTRLLKRVRPFALGIGSTNRTEEINVSGNSTGNSILFNESGDKETISLVSLDNFTAEQGIQCIDFLKIDTEGYELEALAGAQRLLESQQIKMLYIESEPIETERHFTPFYKLAEKLGSYGYEVFGVYEQQPHWSGAKSLLYFNPVFINRALVS